MEEMHLHQDSIQRLDGKRIHDGGSSASTCPGLAADSVLMLGYILRERLALRRV